MMRRWIVCLLVPLLVLVSACSRPPAPPSPAKETPPAVEPPAPTPAPAPEVTPRLLLDLPLGDGPDQPGRLAERVGGISPMGPFAVAAEWGSLYLVDAAKNRILQYDLQGQWTGTIPAPWMDDQWADLSVSPFGLVVTVPGVQYTVGRDGRFLEIGAAPATPVVDYGKGPWPLGQDRLGNRYQRAVADGGVVVQRVHVDGTVTASAPISGLQDTRDWYVSRDGGLYSLTYVWGAGGIERAQVYEVLAQINFSSPPGGFDPTPPPLVLGRPLPSRLRLVFSDWAPLEVTAEVDRWNIWRLLAAATPAQSQDPAPAPPEERYRIEATLPDGATVALPVHGNEFSVDGVRYTLPYASGLRAVVQRLRFSEAGLKAAVTAATSVQVALVDLPGVERALRASDREQLLQSLTGAMPVNPAAGPKPLEAPFPRYGLRLEGTGWQTTLLLNGDRYLGAALHTGDLAALVKGWLPVPQMQPDDVGYLYLADRLEIGQGADLTRWKSTVVRRLVEARAIPGYKPSTTEPFALTFWVKGEKRVVQVDAEGFTYGGKRYPGSGLTEMLYLQGVP